MRCEKSDPIKNTKFKLAIQLFYTIQFDNLIDFICRYNKRVYNLVFKTHWHPKNIEFLIEVLPKFQHPKTNCANQNLTNIKIINKWKLLRKVLLLSSGDLEEVICVSKLRNKWKREKNRLYIGKFENVCPLKGNCGGKL